MNHPIYCYLGLVGTFAFFITVLINFQQWCTPLLKACFQFVVFNPLKIVYLQGPSVGGLGFWGGLPLLDICAQLTSVPSDFWVVNMGQCHEQIDKKVVAISIVILMITFLATIRWIVQSFFWYYFFTQPLLKRLEQQLLK